MDELVSSASHEEEVPSSLIKEFIIFDNESVAFLHSIAEQSKEGISIVFIPIKPCMKLTFYTLSPAKCVYTFITFRSHIDCANDKIAKFGLKKACGYDD